MIQPAYRQFNMDEIPQGAIGRKVALAVRTAAVREQRPSSGKALSQAFAGSVRRQLG